MPEYRKLISAAEFQRLARKGIKPEDVGEFAVFKAVALDRVKQIDQANRMVPFILSNARMDREGDTIQVGGWNLVDYANNPVVLWAHSHDLPPIGRAERTYIDGKNLRADDRFMGPELSPFADTIYRMIVERFLNACSVGFQPDQWEVMESGVNFIKQSLLEHSVCPVPAHPDALVSARSKGIDTAPLRDWAERILDNLGRKRVSTSIRADLERLRAQADPLGREMVAVIRDVVASAPSDDEQAADDLKCKSCDGTGARHGAEADKEMPCATCGGTGFADHVEPAEQRAAAAEDNESDTPETVEPTDGECPTGYQLGEDGMCHLNAEAGGRDESAASVAADAGRTVAAAGRTIAAVSPGERILTPAEVRAVLAEGSIRWNQRLSKAFDVNAAEFPAGSEEEALVAAHLEASIKHLERRRQRVPSVRMGAWLTAIDDVIREWRLHDVRNIDYEGKEQPPAWEVIQLNSTLSNDFLVNGMRFISQPEPERRATLRVSPSWYGMDVTVYGLHSTGEASKLLAEIAAKASEINYLRGEAFSLSGEFMPRSGETLVDLVLDPKNQAAIGRLVKLVNDKGAKIDNRGAMLMGPPGTGKTLSARILRNETKTTYIWVSARDFHYAGSFGGFVEAFDIARECAADGKVASVIVLDDVDNYITPHTVDLLKSEMDGIGQTKGIVTLMMTNFPELMPEALIDRPGRFHDVLRFTLPDDVARRALIGKFLPDLDAEGVDAAVAATEGYSGAHIRELARFAGILAEQDGLEPKDALTAALAKLAEQRETINQAQTAGSRYRMPSACVRKTFSESTRPDEPTGRESVAAARASGVGAQPQDGATGEKAGRVLSQKNESDLRTAQECLGRVLASVDGKASKRGRALSSANEDRLRKASGLLDEVLTQLAEDEAEEQPAASADDNGVEVVLTVFDQIVPAPASPAVGEVITLAADCEPASVVHNAVVDAIEERWMRLTGRVDLG